MNMIHLHCQKLCAKNGLRQHRVDIATIKRGGGKAKRKEYIEHLRHDLSKGEGMKLDFSILLVSLTTSVSLVVQPGRCRSRVRQLSPMGEKHTTQPT